MGTRSQIGIENADGTVTGIYCHWDGYPSHNGRMLVEHYATEDRVRELMTLGDISSLNEEIGEKHPFDTFGLKIDIDPRWEKWCKSYSRDRGEADTEAKDFRHANSFLNDFPIGGTEWAYLYRDGKWLCRSMYRHGDWVEVSAYLNAEEEA